jgi:hypothetical protein
MEPRQPESLQAGSWKAAVPWLAGIEGRLRVDVAGKPATLLEIHDGAVSARPAAGAEPADAVVEVDGEQSAEAFRQGRLNPVVAALQGRLSLAGDHALAIKVILGLQTLTGAGAPANGG